MTSTNRVTGYLEDTDYKLFQEALKSYDLKESELAREILHGWLFANKLSLRRGKNGKRKT